MNSSSLRGPAWGVLATLLFACGETPPPASNPPASGVVGATGTGGARGGNGGTTAAGTGAPASGGANGGGTAGQIAAPPATAGGMASPTPAASGSESAGGGGADGSVAPPALVCTPRMVTAGDAQLHFHHVHFNSPDPSKDIEFFMKFYGSKPIDFCKDATSGEPTPAAQTDRGYFLFTRVAEPVDPTLDSELDHVGFANPSPTMELQRLMALDAPLWPLDGGNNITGQCEDVMMGTACFSGTFFYTQLPSGARIEVSNSPGPSRSGFAHIHLKGPLPEFFSQVLGPALQMGGDAAHVDGVNLTNTLLSMFEPMPAKETKGKPIDHLAYSTTDLMAHYDRIKGAGIEIADEIAIRPEYGFKSFFVKSPQGIWVEIVEDTPFQP